MSISSVFQQVCDFFENIDPIFGVFAAIAAIATFIVSNIRKNKSRVHSLENKIQSNIPVQSQPRIHQINITSKPELAYDGLMQLSPGNYLPYANFVGSLKEGEDEYYYRDISIQYDLETFTIPIEFISDKFDKSNDTTEKKCRLKQYRLNIKGWGQLPSLHLTFSPITYMDYLQTNDRIDEKISNNSSRTFREIYANDKSLRTLPQTKLSNICGVGIFVFTCDNKVIISQHSSNVHVYPKAWSYSASGTMDWSEQANPFTEVIRECNEEIRHSPEEDNLHLFGFGADSRYLFLQFAFYEKSSKSSEEILQEAPYARDHGAEMTTTISLHFTPEVIIERIMRDFWEPSAASNLIVLLCKKFGHDHVYRLIDPDNFVKRYRERMNIEWESRAKRKGVMAVMSTRYQEIACERQSQVYVDRIMQFIDQDIAGKNVLELGCGIGRITERLVHQANILTCIDISATMIERNKEYLGNSAKKVKYIQTFMQDYSEKHDIIICSLVLIHTIQQIEFQKIVDAISLSADTIFLFEHADDSVKENETTKPRGEKELLSAFKNHTVAKKEKHNLFDDKIILLKLVAK